MKLLATIRDEDLGFPKVEIIKTKKREASRAVLIDDDKRVCLVWAKNGNFYKLAGGGVDRGETKERALHREVQEEVGYTCETICEIGRVRSVKIFSPDPEWNGICLDAMSYCWLARAKDFVGTNLMGDEISDGFESKWFDNIDQAISAIEEEKYRATKDTNLCTIKFFVARELTFLREAKKLLAKL